MSNCIRFVVFLVCDVSLCQLGGSTPAGQTQGQATKPEPGTSTVQAVGTVEPEEVVEVAAQITGRIQKFGVDPKDKDKPIDFGSVVKAGDVLVHLDSARYEAEVAEAKAKVQRAEAQLAHAAAKVNLAEQELQRAARREATKTGDSGDVEVAKSTLMVVKAATSIEEAGLAQARAALRRAEIQLGHCTIRSPIDSVIVDRRCVLGQAVTDAPSATSLFLLAKDTRKVQVWLLVKETDVPRIVKGQPAQFTVDALPKETFQGRVYQKRLNATADKGVVSYTVVLEADNADGRLLPYLTARANIDVGGKP
jgi:HlyD family secretion protein